MNMYEGMIIFPESLKDEEWDDAIGYVRGEIERLGGGVESVTRLGKRAFARPLGKRQTAGHYAVILFRMEGGQIATLRERLALGGRVFRAQFLRVEASQAKAPVGDEHAVAQ